MSNYTHTLYIILGTKTHNQWEDFVTGISQSFVMASGTLFAVNRATVSTSQLYLEQFASVFDKKQLALIMIETEDIINGENFGFLHDYMWAVHNYGNPGKIIILGHGSLTAEIGAYSNKEHTNYMHVSQHQFIDAIFPNWPPPKPVSINNPIIVTGIQGLKVIALRQCYAARTQTNYVSPNLANSYDAAAGSAAEITAATLRSKGWDGTGIIVTASPEYNEFTTNTGVIKMAAIMPVVNNVKATKITFDKKECTVKEEIDHRKYVETWIGTFSDKGYWTKIGKDYYWYAGLTSKVKFPDHWIRKKESDCWKIYLPEYVEGDIVKNKIKSKAPSGEYSMHLKHTALKVRHTL